MMHQDRMETMPNKDQEQEEPLPEFKDQVRNSNNDHAPRVPPMMTGKHNLDFKDQVREATHPTSNGKNVVGIPSVAPIKNQFPVDDVELGMYTESEQRRPGAIRVDPMFHNSEPPPSSSLTNDCMEVTLETAQVTNTTQQEEEFYPIHAQIVTDLTQEAIPIHSFIKIARRKFLLLLLLLIGVASAIVVVSIVVSNNNNDNGQEIDASSSTNDFGTNRPTMPPTIEVSPTNTPLEWIPVGMDIVGYSDDDVGTSVAISRYGTSIAVGGPGRAESVQVFTFSNHQWLQVAEIDVDLGERFGDVAFGKSVSLDESGSILAMGIPAIRDDYEGTGNTTTGMPGRVRVHKLNTTAISNLLENYDPHNDNTGNVYQQLGSDIMGNGPDDEFGRSVDLSGDGSVIAIGSKKNCLVRVLSYSNDQKDWIPKGQAFNCTDMYDQSSGVSVSLSRNGSILAMGLPDDFIDVEAGGLVRIYRFDDAEGGSWKLLGQVLSGEKPEDGFGTSLSLSDDGMIVAVGMPFNDVNNNDASSGSTVDPSIGSCRVFEFNHSENRWLQRGSDIDGEALFDFFGFSVSLNAKGDVVAIGATGNNGNGDDSGHVRIFQFDHFTNQWNQVGHDIDGPFAFAQSGTSVALSASGDTIVIGAPHPLVEATRENDRSGYVEVYETGVMSDKGNFPISIVVQSDLWEQSLVMFLERMDVHVTTLVANFSRSDQAYDENDNDDYSNATSNLLVDFNTTLMISEHGVYRLVLFKEYFWDYELGGSNGWYQIVFSEDPTDKMQTLVQVPGNFTAQSQYTFEAKKLTADTTPTLPSGEAFVTLHIDFDDHPQDIHWVLVAKHNVTVDSDSSKSTQHRSILAFGPEQEYAYEYAGQSLNETIDISSVVLAGAEFEFIFTDDGRDGLCCSNGEGKYQLNSDGKLLFSSTAEGKRREVHTFVLVP